MLNSWHYGTLWKKYNKFVNVNPFFCEKFKLWCEWIWLKWIKDVDDHGGCSRMIDNGKMAIFLRHPVVGVGRGLNTWHNGGVHGSQCYTNQ